MRNLSPSELSEALRALPNLPASPKPPYNVAVADDSPEVLAARLRTALDLCALGESIRRAQLRREHPDVTDDEIEALLAAWLMTRPGAEHGDAWGRPISWPPSPH
jgi:Rv0078B-related antitoxin